MPGDVSQRNDQPDLNSEMPSLGVVSEGIWSLAWPTMIAMGAGTVVRFTDFAMVGSLGPSALAGVGLGGQFAWLLESLGAIAPAGLAAILARAVGAGDRAVADQSFRQAQVLGAVMAIVSSACLLPLTAQAIALYGVEPEVVRLGGDYLWWRIWGMVPLSFVMVFGAALRAAGDVRTPLWSAAIASVVNIFLNWVLIYGNLGAPALGVSGAAIASNVAIAVMLLIFVWLWLRRQLVLIPAAGSWRPDVAMMRRLLRVGTPSGVQGGLFQIGLILFQRIMSPFGTSVIAAYNVGSTILSFSYIPGVGYSMAAATLVGQHLGARQADQAEAAGWRATWSAVLAMSVVGAILFLAGRPIAELFTTDPEVVDLTQTILAILAIAHPFMAVEFALGGALRGAGDTLFPMLTVFAGLIVVRIGLAVGAVALFDAPIEWVWAALIVDYIAKAIMMALRFARGSWKLREV